MGEKEEERGKGRGIKEGRKKKEYAENERK